MPTRAATTHLVRKPTRNRETSTRTAVYDTLHPDNVFDPAGGRYVVVCEEHGLLVNDDNLSHALHVAAHPAYFFCGECQIMLGWRERNTGDGPPPDP